MHRREKGNRVPWMGEQASSVFFCRFGQRAASDDFMHTEYLCNSSAPDLFSSLVPLERNAGLGHPVNMPSLSDFEEVHFFYSIHMKRTA